MNTPNVLMPSAVQAIKASPKGRSVIAFFDLDGTFINGFTAAHLSKDRLKTKDIGLDEVREMISVGLNAAVGKAGFDEMMGVGAAAWKGRFDEDLQEMADRVFEKSVLKLIYPEMREILRAHKEHGHTIVLSSSATAYQVDPVARFLEIDNVLCNRFEMDDGVLTGKMCEPVIWGKTKASEAQKFAKAHKVDMGDCYFYADGDEDAALMHLVGHPRPTNPRKGLTVIAEKRGWPIQRFESRNENSAARNIGGWASVIPAGLMGIGAGLFKRDKRAGLNVTSANWMKMLFKINGVDVNITGKDNLWKARPAVFIFNHRNNFDALLTAMLVEKDFSGVGKKELENDWLMGTIGKIGDIAFIDRTDSGKAVEALKPLEELARKGISIMLSPEGTRYDTTSVGPFKKGAFRMAMAAGLPIVPIVFRNAEIIASRDSSVMCPGTVDVSVLEPIALDDWTLDNLAEKIDEVRELYIDTLENWPG